MKNKNIFNFISNKTKILIVCLIIISIWLYINLINFPMDFGKFQEDLIFFKVFGNTKDDNTNEDFTNKENYEVSKIPQYRFDVKYENIKLQDINLLNTVNHDTLIKEKIAPGTKGNFNLILNSTQDIDYQVKFESKNKKPQNLKFYLDNVPMEFNSLEDLQSVLQGHLYANEEKVIKIDWKWDYENSNIGNKQDTEDSKNIFQYNFEVKVLGKKYS